MPTADSALAGRDTPIPVVAPHLVLDTPIVPPFPEGLERIVVGMGCFWVRTGNLIRKSSLRRLPQPTMGAGKAKTVP